MHSTKLYVNRWVNLASTISKNVSPIGWKNDTVNMTEKSLSFKVDSGVVLFMFSFSE